MLFGGGSRVVGLAQYLDNALDTQADNEAAQNGDEGSRQHVSVPPFGLLGQPAVLRRPGLLALQCTFRTNERKDTPKGQVALSVNALITL